MLLTRMPAPVWFHDRGSMITFAPVLPVPSTLAWFGHFSKLFHAWSCRVFPLSFSMVFFFRVFPRAPLVNGQLACGTIEI